MVGAVSAHTQVWRTVCHRAVHDYGLNLESGIWNLEFGFWILDFLIWLIRDEQVKDGKPYPIESHVSLSNPLGSATELEPQP